MRNVTQMHSDINVYLASGSPRRRQMISYLFENIEFFSLKSEEPRWEKNEKAEKYLERCVAAKLQEAQSLWSAPEDRRALLLVADTIVVLGKEILGKPDSPNHAAQLLQKLSGRTHTVMTAVAFVYKNKNEVKKDFFIVRSAVSFRKIKPVEIKNYIKTGEPLDKAGAYALQGKGLTFVTKIDGCYQNIIGFPLFDFLKRLETYK